MEGFCEPQVGRILKISKLDSPLDDTSAGWQKTDIEVSEAKFIRFECVDPKAVGL